MPANKILKRNGDIVDFDRERIALAIRKATDATQHTSANPINIDSPTIFSLSVITNILNKRISWIKRQSIL